MKEFDLKTVIQYLKYVGMIYMGWTSRCIIVI